MDCRRLPNPDSDELTRVLRRFDRLHRPTGADLPVERYFAWAAERDAGLLPEGDATEALQRLVDEQLALVRRIEGIGPTTGEALSVVEGYLKAHAEAHRAMEEVLAGRRLGDRGRVQAAEKALRESLNSLRAARVHRHDAEVRLGLVPSEESQAAAGKK